MLNWMIVVVIEVAMFYIWALSNPFVNNKCESDNVIVALTSELEKGQTDIESVSVEIEQIFRYFVMRISLI